MIFIHGYTNYVAQNEFNYLGFKKELENFLSKFPQTPKIIPCPRRNICNNCEHINMSGDILNAGGNVTNQEDYGFTGSLLKFFHIVIDDSSKNKLTSIMRTPMLNIYKQQLNHPIYENIYDKKMIKKII